MTRLPPLIPLFSQAARRSARDAFNSRWATPTPGGGPPRVTRRRSTRSANSAFTLLELMVAVGITSLMLLMVNQIFNSTTRAMSRSLGVADIIANERGFGEQLDLDAEAMIGPDERTDPNATAAEEDGGLLVIVQCAVPSATINKGPRLAEETRDATHPDGPVRSDQLMFFRSRSVGSPDAPVPVTPKDDGTYLNDFRRRTLDADTEYTADYLKVWYGHARKVLPDGSDGADLGVTTGNAYNAFAQDWVLARQAMFLVDEGDTDPSSAVVSADGKWDMDPSNFIHADTAEYNSQMNIYSNTNTAYNPTSNIHSYLGLTDSAGQILGGINTVVAHTGQDSILKHITSNGTLDSTTNTYQQNVYDYLYLTQRLRANPNPHFDPGDPVFSYAAWQIAQMHPVVFAGVSDFIVEFAGDIDDDPAIPPPASPNDGTPPDNTPDRVDHDSDASTPEVIKWYGYWYNDPTDTGPGPLANGRKRNPANPTDPNFDLPYNPDEPMVFEPPTSGYAPYSESSGTTLPANADATFVFGHDADGGGPGTPWPYLLRIRFRAHDKRGLLESGSGQHGMWIEHVVAVKRD